MTTPSRQVAGFACNTRFLFLLLVLLLTGLTGLVASTSSATTTGPVFTYDMVAHSAQATATSAPVVRVLAGSHAQARAPSRGTHRLQSMAGVAAEGAIAIRPPLAVSSKQFGSKWGEHAGDYGFDLKSAAGRDWYRTRIRDVHLNPDEVRRGAWNPSGGGGENYFFFRQGEDLVITRPGGEFVSMFPGGSTNTWFKNAEVFPH